MQPEEIGLLNTEVWAYQTDVDLIARAQIYFEEELVLMLTGRVESYP